MDVYVSACLRISKNVCIPTLKRYIPNDKNFSLVFLLRRCCLHCIFLCVRLKRSYYVSLVDFSRGSHLFYCSSIVCDSSSEEEELDDFVIGFVVVLGDTGGMKSDPSIFSTSSSTARISSNL